MGTAVPSFAERKREIVRSELREVALGVFASDGFNAATVENIAAAAGISARTFFRYFPTKEDVVFDAQEAVGDAVAARFRERPQLEPATVSLKHALLAAAAEIEADPRSLKLLTMIMEHDGLRARFLARQAASRSLIVGALAPRTGDRESAEILAGVACVVMELAVHAWMTAPDGGLVGPVERNFCAFERVSLRTPDGAGPGP